MGEVKKDKKEEAMFIKYNNALCHAISALAKHSTTGLQIGDDDYQRIHNTLKDLRIDLHNSCMGEEE